MADLAASDITVTILDRKIGSGSQREVNAQLVFGNGALTYPAGGIPISKAALGLPNHIESLQCYSTGAAGIVVEYDRTNAKLRLFRSAAVAGGGSHSHGLVFKDAAVADGAGTRVNVGTNLLGANTGGDLTVAGGGANGGVAAATLSLSAAALAEFSGAPAATTLLCKAVGW